MCSTESSKMAHQIPLPLDYQNMYLGSNGYYPSFKIPAQPKNCSISSTIFTLSIMLCLFSCLLTVTLSYKWHTETNNQIDRLLDTVEEVIKDLNTFTSNVKSQLAKHERNVFKETKDKSDGISYNDELDEDYEDDRFMGKDLFDNFSPSKNSTDHSVNDLYELNGKAKRSAEVDETNGLKNHLNSPSNQKKMVDVDIESEESEENTVRTYIRRKQKKVEISRKKNFEEQDTDGEDFKETIETFAAAHFTSDSSKYNTKTHSHYHGNGRLRHPDGEFKDWTPYLWDANINNGNNFQMKNGKVEIRKSGLYFIYAQIYYSDQHDINGYYIIKNDEKILGCTTTRHRETQSDSCYTGGLTYLNVNDVISIKGLDSERYIILDPVKSFFGLFKIFNENKKV